MELGINQAIYFIRSFSIIDSKVLKTEERASKMK